MVYVCLFVLHHFQTGTRLLISTCRKHFPHEPARWRTTGIVHLLFDQESISIFGLWQPAACLISRGRGNSPVGRRSPKSPLPPPPRPSCTNEMEAPIPPWQSRRRRPGSVFPTTNVAFTHINVYAVCVCVGGGATGVRCQRQRVMCRSYVQLSTNFSVSYSLRICPVVSVPLAFFSGLPTCGTIENIAATTGTY